MVGPPARIPVQDQRQPTTVLVLLPAASADQQVLFERVARVAHRHPLNAEGLLRQLGATARAAGDAALAIDALVQRFALLEPRGRAVELRVELEQALRDASSAPLALQAARAGEALGRLAYQQGEYQAAQEHWTQALSLAQAAGNRQMLAATTVGLAQVLYAQGDWAAGLQRLQGIEGPDAQDSYLSSKLALNLGVGHLELGDLPAAERQFSHGLAAARRGAHREFEAEAHLHLARTALARQQLHLAIADCRLVLGIAARHGYSWLEAAASRAWTEIALARGDRAAAIRSTRHGLQLAERIHARTQASLAHRQLSVLLQQEGELGAALEHLWQHLGLQAELERLSSPRGMVQRPPEDHTESAPEAQLLQLGARRLELARLEPAQALNELLRAARPLLGLDMVRLWLAPALTLMGAAGQAQVLQPFGEAAERMPALGAGQAGYLARLQAQAGPHALSEAEIHPQAAELSGFAAWGGQRARIELGLFRRGHLVGLLWLVAAAGRRHWTRAELLAAQQLALMFEAVLREA